MAGFEFLLNNVYNSTSFHLGILRVITKSLKEFLKMSRVLYLFTVSIKSWYSLFIKISSLLVNKFLFL